VICLEEYDVNRNHLSPRLPSADEGVRLRVLCLGNDSLADDALGPEVARQLQQYGAPDVEIVDTPASGLSLLEHMLDAEHLVVVDTIQTAGGSVGTVRQFHDRDMRTPQGGSPHYVGIFEALKMARQLGLPVADDVLIVAVEAADCLTFGGAMCEAVRAAIPEVVRKVAAAIAARAGLEPD